MSFNGWLSSEPLMQRICSEYRLDGFNIIPNTAWLSKSISGLNPHNILNIQMNLYKIGDIDAVSIEIYIDGTLKQIYTFNSWDGAVYYRKECFDYNELKATKKINFYESHSSTSAEIKIVVNFINDGYIGMNRFRVLSFNCESSCLTCSGLIGCTSCPDGSFLLLPPGPSSCGVSCNLRYYPD